MCSDRDMGIMGVVVAEWRSEASEREAPKEVGRAWTWMLGGVRLGARAGGLGMC